MAQQVSPMRPNQKTMVGVVVSDKMDKTVVVAVETLKRHRLYHKTIRRTKRYKAHDPNNVCRLGDVVRIVETRPLSKEKRWRVVEILEHHEVAEVQPSAIDAELERTRLETVGPEPRVPSAPAEPHEEQAP
ncbi:MAG: 30S ribosomal protein S17 [Chloroflexota bacterium]